MKNEKVAVYIGRFQIMHHGHVNCLQHGFDNYDRVIVLIGSSDIARSPKNPFTFKERYSVLDAECDKLSHSKLTNNKNVSYNIVKLHDSTYNNSKWLREVQLEVSKITKSNDITIIGSRKEGDSSTEYLNYFPHWKQDLIISSGTTNSTSYRNTFFNEFSTECIDPSLPQSTKDFLNKFIQCNVSTYEYLKKEHSYIENYKKTMYSSLPYKTIPFFTGDSLVVCAGHVLLVRRKSQPGKGLLALPGGFFSGDTDLSQVDTALRELKEETKIDYPPAKLRGLITDVMEFGDFNRSLRWRIITKVIHIQLPDNKLPKVKGSDDAESAQWIPLGDIMNMRDQFFEDHFDIIQTMLKM